KTRLRISVSIPVVSLHTLLVRSTTPYLLSFTPTPPTEPYTLSLHDALPIFSTTQVRFSTTVAVVPVCQSSKVQVKLGASPLRVRSEEHTSELQSLRHLVCRLLLEKKKTISLKYFSL